MNDNSKLAKPIRSLTSLVRPKYSPGLLLQDDDLTAAVSYTRNLSRLLFRTLFGCGVLCGLRVGTPNLKCGKLHVDIAKGVALNCVGDPIEVPGGQEVVIDTCETPLPCRMWFAVKHMEACCVPRSAQCPPDEVEPPSNCTRERDGFEIRVFADRPPCSCGCKKLGVPDTSTNPDATFSKGTAAKKLPAAKAKSADKDGVVAAAASANTAVTEDPCANVPPLELEPASAATPDACLCNLRTGSGSCYEEFYRGECACDCCDCDWVILAVAEREGEGWKIDHSVRRFVRPVLMRDWVVEDERKPQTI